MNSRIDDGLLSAVVTSLKWENTKLILKINITFSGFSSDRPLSFYAVNGMKVARINFSIDSINGSEYTISTDIMNPGYNHSIPRGTHFINVVCGEDILAVCTASPEIVDRFSSDSRTYLFDGRSRGYCISFFVDDELEGELPFVFHVITVRVASYSSEDGVFKGLDWDEIYTPAQKRMKLAVKFMRKTLHLNLPIITNAHKVINYKENVEVLKSKPPKKKKTLLFMSEQNKSITANQKAVYDRLVQRGDDKKFNILFSFRATVSEEQSKASWRRLLAKMAKADIIILDDHAPVMDWLVLKPETVVIQLWHAGAGFKSSGYSRWGNKGCPSTFSCHRQYTYGIAGSKHIAHFFSEVWGINTEQVLPTGMPRMDEYLDEVYREKTTKKLYSMYPMCEGKKVILFAPTYRGKNRALAFYPYDLIDFDALYKLCKDEYIVLFKMHPWVAESVPIPEEYSDVMLDVGRYPNINDLFYITDLLITDYSSNIFEYSLMRKPILFFAYDEIQYSFSRGFHRPYRESAPGKVVSTFDELLEAIKNEDFEFEKVETYVDLHFDYIDTHASDRVIDWLIFGNMPEEFRKAIDDKKNDVEYFRSLQFPAVIDEPMELDFSTEEDLEPEAENKGFLNRFFKKN